MNTPSPVHGVQHPTRGDVWNGFEWVTPDRYEELRTGSMPELPPIQPSMGGVHQPDHPARERTGKGNAGESYEYTRTFSFAYMEEERKREEACVVELLKEVIGENPSRGGLLETPKRVVEAWKDWTAGYHMKAADILKVFEDGAEGCDEMVVVRNIPIYSHCEHHLAAIFGTATIGYLPNGKIVGLSKLNRLADMFARRLQVQERMTNQIADALMQHLGPLGCGVVVTARHMCMESRGVKQGSTTVTSALRGNFKADPTVRAEFLALAHNGDK